MDESSQNCQDWKNEVLYSLLCMKNEVLYITDFVKAERGGERERCILYHLHSYINMHFIIVPQNVNIVKDMNRMCTQTIFSNFIIY